MSESLRVLLCACAELPGTSAVGVRLDQFSRALEGAATVDALCLKGEGVAHIERVRGARLLRVPTLPGSRGQAPDAYRRALKRQLAAEEYDLIVAGDLTSGTAIVDEGQPRGAKLVIDLAEAEWATLAAGSSGLRAAQSALRQAALVFAQSRAFAKLLVTHVDPRRVELLERAVDLGVFGPEKLLPRKRPRITVFGGQERVERWPRLLELAAAMGRSLPGARIELLGAPTEGSGDLDQRVERLGFAARVKCRPTHSPLETARRLARADVVITPVFTSSPVLPAALPHRALEALATGRPLVVARLQNPDTRTTGGAPVGYVEVPFVSDDVARATVALLSDPHYADDMASAGREVVRENASLGTRLVRLREILARAVGREISARSGPEAPASESWTHGTHAPLRLPPPPVTGRSEAPEPDHSHVVVRAVMPSTSQLTEERVATVHERAENKSGVASAAITPATEDHGQGALPSVAASSVPQGEQGGTTEQSPRVSPLPRTLQVGTAAAPTDAFDAWAGETTADQDPSPLTFVSPHRVSSVAAVLDQHENGSSGGAQESLEPLDPWLHDTVADASPLFVSDEREARHPTPAPGALHCDVEGARGSESGDSEK